LREERFLISHTRLRLGKKAQGTKMMALHQNISPLSGTSDLFGYAASSLVLATFCIKKMIPLRIIALCGNIAFLTYAVLLHLFPIFLLHALLLPINIWRLSQASELRLSMTWQFRHNRRAR
jgi:hypothetical protein